MAVRVTDFLRIFADVMTNERIIQIDSVDAYNKLYGWETLHPLVTVVNHANPMASDLNHSRLRSTLVALLAKNYGQYALFLKQGDGCSIRYGREKYDYTFFDYDQREALHLSEREQHMVVELFDRIEEELQHPIDRHSQTLITDATGLRLDYCMRYYDRQFITRHKVNSEVFLVFQKQLKEYFENGHPERNGLPTVVYFADKACLSPNYFGDLISKETGITCQHHIQDAVIDRSKQLLLETKLSISEIAYQLGFEYPQHFTRLFKSRTGMTPNEYRLTA